MKRNIVLAFFALLLLCACSSQTQTEPAAPVAPTVTATIAAPVPTQSPTATSSPERPFTPVPTQVNLPVGNGEEIPQLGYEVISLENIDRIEEIASYGYARPIGETWNRYQAAFHLTSDQKTVVVGTTTGIEFVDVQTGTMTDSFPVNYLFGFDISADGQWLATRSKEEIAVWNRQGEKLASFESISASSFWGNDRNSPVSISPDGRLVAIVREDPGEGDILQRIRVHVYQVSDGEEVAAIRGRVPLFTPDGKTLAVIVDASVAMISTTSWEKEQSLPWCAIGIDCRLSFSPDSSLMVTTRENSIDVRRISDRALIRQVNGVPSSDYSFPEVTLSPDNTLMLVKTGQKYQPESQTYTFNQILIDVADGNWISNETVPDQLSWVNNDASIGAFTATRAGNLPPFDMMPDLLMQVQNDGQVQLMGSSGQALYTCINERCEQTDFKENETILVDENLQEYKLQQSGTHYELFKNDDVLLAFDGLKGQTSWIFDDHLFIVTSNTLPGYAELSVYNLARGERIYFATNAVIFTFATDHHRLAMNIGEASRRPQAFKLVLIDLSNDEVTDFASQYLTTLAVSEALNLVVTGRYGSEFERIGWDDHQRGAIDVPALEGMVSQTEFSPDGRILMLEDGSGTLYALAYENLAYKKQWIGHGYAVLKMRFSEDGRFLATCSRDGFIRIWGVLAESTNTN